MLEILVVVIGSAIAAFAQYRQMSGTAKVRRWETRAVVGMCLVVIGAGAAAQSLSVTISYVSILCMFLSGVITRAFIKARVE
jgi:hypothetical protein